MAIIVIVFTILFSWGMILGFNDPTQLFESPEKNYELAKEKCCPKGYTCYDLYYDEETNECVDSVCLHNCRWKPGGDRKSE